MSTRMPRAAIIAVLALGLVGGGCTATVVSTTTPKPVSSAICDSPGQPACVTLNVGLGYIGSVQFAPFYLAQQAGYYTAAGLVVNFQNKVDPDLVTLVGQGAIDIGVADGTSVIPAVSQGIPIKYVATIYGTFPNIVFAKASSGITTAADLRGKKIGTPGRYGSSWVMLQALLGSAGMTPDDVTIQEYPDYGQGVAVQQGAVDAATGFSNNEPVALELTGAKAVVLHVDDVVRLPGPGLIASVATIGSKRTAIAAFVGATLRAMDDIFADQSKGLDAAIAAVPDLGTSRATQAAILKATVESWFGVVLTTHGNGFGGIDRPGWQASIDYMTRLGLVPKPVTVDDLIDTTLLPATSP